MESNYKLRYLESFYSDLLQTAEYISGVLKNADTSNRLVYKGRNIADQI